MRLLFLSHYFAPEGNAPASRSYEHCKRWVDLGHEVTVITGCPNVPHGRPYQGYRNRLLQEEWIDGIRVIRVWTFLAANQGTLRRSLNYLSYLFVASLRGLCFRRFDVLIATSPQFFCGLAGSLVSTVLAKPFVLEVRDLWPESIEAVGAVKGDVIIRVLSWLEKVMYRSADHIVCVGTGYRDKLIERGVPRDKISVITNGADLSMFAPGAADEGLRERFGLRGKFVVGYVGTLGMSCGLDFLLEAAERMKAEGMDDVVFLLVGDGARRKELEQECRIRGLQRVVFTGQLSKQEIPPLLRTVDVCLVHLRALPLFRSVLPSKIFEAFATSKPVIIGVPGNATDVVLGVSAGIEIPSEDADALVAAIHTLRADPVRTALMGAHGRRAVEVEYNRDSLAAELIRIVESRVLLNDAETFVEGDPVVEKSSV